MTDRERNINTMIGLTVAGAIVTIVIYAAYGPLAGGVAVILAAIAVTAYAVIRIGD